MSLRICSILLPSARPDGPGAPTRARCIFSECLNESTLQQSPGAPPGPSSGPASRRAPFRPLLNLASRTHTALRSVLDDLVASAVPSDCRICLAPLVRASALPVCDPCRTALAPQSGPLCHCCGEALDLDESVLFRTDALCRFCTASPPHFARAVAYGVYASELREMLHLFKYERVEAFAGHLGALLAQSIATLHAHAAFELDVIAVPLFRGKRRARGYNQSELLAHSAVRHLSRTQPQWKLRCNSGALTRTRNTRSQFELTPAGRRSNMRGAFAADPARLQPGREVLLIDDIYTTGATARECARVLRQAGAPKVWVATLARAQTPQVALWSSG